MSNSTSPLDQHIEQIKQLAADGSTNAEIVAVLRDQHGLVTSEASIRRAKKRAGFAPKASDGRTGSKRQPALAVNGDVATAISPVTGVPMSIEELMALYKLDPEEWEPEAPIASWWGDPAAPKYQLKVKFNRKREVTFVIPARTPGDYIAPKIRKYPHGTSRLWVVAGDQQVPNHDAPLHKAICGFLTSVKPHGMVNTGDLLDFGDISKHRDSVEWGNSAQECIDVGYSLLRDYRRACESMRMVYMTGNHDARLYREMLDRAERLFGLRRATISGETPEAHLLSLKNLLRADELNVEVIDPGADYEQGQFAITENLVVRHGSRTGARAALKTTERTNHGCIIGHTHYQSHEFRVLWNEDKTRRTLHAVETGALCKVHGGLGYAVDPNWVPGFVTVEEWEDGRLDVDLVQWDGESFSWRGQRYS